MKRQNFVCARKWIKMNQVTKATAPKAIFNNQPFWYDDNTILTNWFARTSRPENAAYVVKLIDIKGRLRDFHSHSFVFGDFFNNTIPMYTDSRRSLGQLDAMLMCMHDFDIVLHNQMRWTGATLCLHHSKVHRFHCVNLIVLLWLF